MAAGAGAGGGGDGEPSISLGGITQQFYFGAGVDAATKADVKKAGREAIQGAYEMMLRDFKTNGAARQMLQRR